MTKDSLIAELVKALLPFAKAADVLDKEFPSELDSSVYETVGPQILRYGEWVDHPNCVPLTFGDFRLAREALSKAHAVHSEEWQPIETASKNLVAIIATSNGKVGQAINIQGKWTWENEVEVRDEVTHWRPLPPPPSKPKDNSI